MAIKNVWYLSNNKWKWRGPYPNTDCGPGCYGWCCGTNMTPNPKRFPNTKNEHTKKILELAKKSITVCNMTDEDKERSKCNGVKGHFGPCFFIESENLND